MEKEIIKRNKELTEKHPYLIPRNVWTGEVSKDYDYSRTHLDRIPEGWRIAFGEQFVNELTEAFDKYRPGFKNEYFITQIKEKYGSLRWYDFGIIPEAYDIVKKYENLSRKTCIECGEPATKISIGYISPYCDKCIGDECYREIESEGQD